LHFKGLYEFYLGDLGRHFQSGEINSIQFTGPVTRSEFLMFMLIGTTPCSAIEKFLSGRSLTQNLCLAEVSLKIFVWPKL
jgi:hypothetical protein